jgi:tRNA pseudouridine55 synthase
VGAFTIEQATTLDALASGRVAPWPPLEAVRHLPMLDIDPVERDAVAHGRPLPAGPVTASPVALVAGGRLVAIADVEAGRLKPRVVFPDA